MIQEFSETLFHSLELDRPTHRTLQILKNLGARSANENPELRALVELEEEHPYGACVGLGLFPFVFLSHEAAEALPLIRRMLRIPDRKSFDAAIAYCEAHVEQKELPPELTSLKSQVVFMTAQGLLKKSPSFRAAVLEQLVKSPEGKEGAAAAIVVEAGPAVPASIAVAAPATVHGMEVCRQNRHGVYDFAFGAARGEAPATTGSAVALSAPQTAALAAAPPEVHGRLWRFLQILGFHGDFGTEEPGTRAVPEVATKASVASAQALAAPLARVLVSPEAHGCFWQLLKNLGFHGDIGPQAAGPLPQGAGRTTNAGNSKTAVQPAIVEAAVAAPLVTALAEAPAHVHGRLWRVLEIMGFHGDDPSGILDFAGFGEDPGRQDTVYASTNWNYNLPFMGRVAEGKFA